MCSFPLPVPPPTPSFPEGIPLGENEWGRLDKHREYKAGRLRPFKCNAFIRHTPNPSQEGNPKRLSLFLHASNDGINKPIILYWERGLLHFANIIFSNGVRV
jgi:hypothetical protein